MKVAIWFLFCFSLAENVARVLLANHRAKQSKTKANAIYFTKASLHDPGLDTDPGQFSVEFYVYTSPGWVRVGSIVGDPGQFLFRSVERAGNYWLG